MEKQDRTQPASVEEALGKAAEAVRNATAVLFTSGAGLSVDSGLPDFRGPEGFWRAYPPMKQLGLELSRASNPALFTRNKTLAWGFWGHRIDLYTRAVPHQGYKIMLDIGQSMRDGYFVYTSNVDGHFARLFPADRILECHGSVQYLQCHRRCSGAIWPTKESFDFEKLELDLSTFRANGVLPSCPKCHGLARPNVLMFEDHAWLPARYEEQEENYLSWINSLKDKDDTRLVVIEVGAGTAVPTVRRQGQRIAATFDTIFGRGQSLLVRINPTESQCPDTIPHVSIPLGGLDALTRLSAAL